MSISIPEIKKDPEIFIKELLEQPTQDTLHETIKDKLESNTNRSSSNN